MRYRHRCHKFVYFCCCAVHKGEFISCTIYFFPGSNVCCSTIFVVCVCIYFSCCCFTSKDNVCRKNIHDLRMKSMLQKSCRIDFVVVFAVFTLALVHQQECFLSFMFRIEAKEWQHLKNGSFEYLSRLCGEKQNRLNDIVHAIKKHSMLQLGNKLMCSFLVPGFPCNVDILVRSI